MRLIRYSGKLRPAGGIPAGRSAFWADEGQVVARLKQIRGTLAALPARVGWGSLGDDRVRDAVHPWRRWYKTARWRRLRWSVLVRDGFRCAMCLRVVRDTSQLVADHIDPASKGTEAGFHDAAGLQTLCVACHSGAKQSAERWAAAGRGGSKV